MKRRQIKFRIWDSLKNCWHRTNNQAIHLFGENTLMGCLDIRNDGTRVGILELNYLIEMQYTGIKDKNGLEIYEGDLVEINEVVFEVTYGLQEVDAFEGYGFNIWTFYDADENGHRANGKRLSKETEVVGNIYGGIREDENYK